MPRLDDRPIRENKNRRKEPSLQPNFKDRRARYCRLFYPRSAKNQLKFLYYSATRTQSKEYSIEEGESVTLEGPRTQYVYHGYGKMEWKDSPPKVYKHIGIVAYESIITGVYTLIDSIMPNYDDKVGVSLLWVGEEPDDFIFLEEFSMLSEQLRLNFNVMLRTSKPGWIGPFGKVNSSHIKSFMPPPGD